MSDKYHLEKEMFYGLPGCNVHESVSQFFADYYDSKKQNEVVLNVNDVIVTIKRKGYA